MVPVYTYTRKRRLRREKKESNGKEKNGKKKKENEQKKHALSPQAEPRGTRLLFAGTSSPMICPVDGPTGTTRKDQTGDKTRRGQG